MEAKVLMPSLASGALPRRTARQTAMTEVHCELCGATWRLPPLLTPEVRREVASLVRNQDKITAIRRLRAEMGLSLRDAKAVEHQSPIGSLPSLRRWPARRE
jgi:hypothetical protein